MTFDQLAELVNKKFSVKGMVDLAELSQSPQAVYKFFYSLHQSEFSPTDRIVLYTSRDIPNSLLKHLYQATSFVDIGNWFILVCTATDVSHQLSQEVDQDPTPFQNLVIKLDQTKIIENNYHLPDTICAIPWMHMEIQNTGTMTPCCMNKGMVIGDINKDSLDDAFYGADMQRLRGQFLAGEKPKECARCWVNEDRGLSSIRIHNSKRLKKQFLLKYLDQPAITSLDIKFNNTCNFKCRICTPDSSSLVASEYKKFLNIPIKPQTNWAESDSFINQIVEN